MEISKVGPCCIIARSLAQLYPTGMCQVELTSDGLGYASEEISKQSIKAWTFIVEYGKMQEERGV